MCHDDLTDLRCLLRSGCRPQPRYRYKILYVGRRHTLPQALRDELKESDCFISYWPAGDMTPALLQSDAVCALFIFDERQPEGTGAELVAFARTLRHRARTPCLICKPGDSPKQLAATIRRLLAETDGSRR